MKYFKAVIEEIRTKEVFFEVPDNADHTVAEAQYDAAIFGDLPTEECDKVNFTDLDRGVEYETRLVRMEEVDMKKEEEYAERYCEFPECVFWNEEDNCLTSGHIERSE